MIPVTCRSCGERYDLDPEKIAAAVHDCGTGMWFVMPAQLAAAMPADRLAYWCDTAVATARQMRGEAGQ